MVLSEDHDYSAVKKSLIAKKAGEITEIQPFIRTFHNLYSAVVNNDNVDKSTVLVIDTLTIWLLRAAQYVKLKETAFTNEQVLLESLTRLFQFVCDYFDTGLGALANAITALLTRLCQFSATIGDLERLNLHLDWVKRVVALPMALKSYFIIVDVLCKEIDALAEQILKMHPELTIDYIRVLEHDSLANVASKTLGTVHSRAYSLDEYVASWKPAVLAGLTSPATRSNIATYLLPVLFRGRPQEYIAFLKEVRNLSCSNDVFLAVARTGHLIMGNFEEIDDFQAVLGATLSPDPTKRLDALEVIVGCIRSTKMTAPEILLIVLDPLWLDVFFKEGTTPQSRNRFVTMMRKALLALRDFACTCEKRLRAQPDDVETKHCYKLTKDSIVQFGTYVRGQMSPSSSYCQLVLATDFLRIFVDHEFDGVSRKSKKKAPAKVIDVFTHDFVQVLLRMASNNYEDIRQRVSSILLCCPYSLIETQHWEEYCLNTMKTLSSLKGRQSDSAAQVFLTLAKLLQIHDQKQYQDLLKNLHNGIRENSDSVHGYFTAFTYILSLDPPTTEFPELFKPLTVSLLEHIVSSWNSIKDNQSEMDQNWRVVKESAGLLKVLMDINWKQNFLFFDKDRFLSMCDVIMSQLATVTHRGAFSAIHPTFVHACFICEKSGLENVLDTWLTDNLVFIKTHSQMISRRSGGIPFLITGILGGMATNTDHLEKEFQNTFDQLLQIASEPYVFDGEEEVDIAQVHAFNCMKQIVNESLPTTLMDQYISSALEISLLNLDHESWSLKNAAVMLCTSLQLRIFGSNQLGDLMQKMNAPLFFFKYPGISRILMEKLEHCKRVDVIIPVLAIISRLTSHKPEDGKVESFLGILEEKYLGYSVWKVREMTAAAITSLTHPSKLISKVESLMSGIPKLESNNEIHGALLCAARMGQAIKQSEGDISSIVQEATTCFTLLENKSASKWLLLSACLKIWKLSSPGDSSILQLKGFFTSNLELAPEYPDSLRRLCLKAAAEILIRADFESENVSSMVALTEKAIQHSEVYEVLFLFLDFWIEAEQPFDVDQVTEQVKSLATRLLQKGDSFVTAQVLDFLVSKGVSLDVTTQSQIPDIASPLVFLGINSGGFSKSTELLKKCIEDEQEKTRLSAVYAAELINRKSGADSVRAESSFLLFRMLFDGSFSVRQAAARSLAKIMEFDSYEIVTVSHKFILSFVGQFQLHATAILSRECHSIEQNLQDAMKDLVSDFEVESDNLYMDQVAYHRLLVSGLRDTQDNHEEFVREINNVTQSISGQFRNIITAWSYNVHIDSAIRKAFNYGILSSSEDTIGVALAGLTQELTSLGYPVGETSEDSLVI